MHGITPELKLKALTSAAFLVKDHKITHVNDSAQACNIKVGVDVRDLICTGMLEYESCTPGVLYLELLIDGKRCAAGVTAEDDHKLFYLLPQYDSEELKAMSLAGYQLLKPLQDSINQIRLLRYRVSKLDDKDAQSLSTAGLNHSLYQLMRDINNMIDASRFSPYRAQLFNYGDLTEVFNNMEQRLNQLSAHLNRQFQYTGLNTPVYSMFDAQALERAFYNMVSNAVKFSPEDSLITVKITTAERRILITVTNECLEGSLPLSQYFNRYRRIPTPETSNFGIGLGTTVIRTIAAAHNGTLYIHAEKNNRVSVTMTVGIQPNTESTLHSKNFHMVYCGGFDTALLELSDILPNSMYED